MIKFFVKRIFFLAIVFSIAAQVVYPTGNEGGSFLVTLGIFIGGAAAVFKIWAYQNIFGSVLRKRITAAATLLNAAPQFISFGLLAASALIDLRLFAGVTVGLLSTVVVICVNGVTEWLGITHNNWHSK